MTRKTEQKVREAVAQLTNKGWDDVDVCDILKAIKLLIQAAEAWFCK
jgi:hypothetical protein